ncbi:MAG: hypothetical protein PHV59_08625 [Victivallales bacterium]|nr:hypothetical protein [Victivallales bacterium]
MRENKRLRKSERGSTILESLMSILLLCLLFFGLMQIFQWTMAKMLTQYSSFYAGKAYSLGYARSIAVRAARIAATGASGHDTSGIPTTAPFTQAKLSAAAEEYMNYGQYGPRSINFEYWEPENITADTPIVEVSYPDTASDFIEATVKISNMPLLTENLSWFLGTTEANPSAKSTTFNYASLYLENN